MKENTDSYREKMLECLNGKENKRFTDFLEQGERATCEDKWTPDFGGRYARMKFADAELLDLMEDTFNSFFEEQPSMFPLSFFFYEADDRSYEELFLMVDLKSEKCPVSLMDDGEMSEVYSSLDVFLKSFVDHAPEE